MLNPEKKAIASLVFGIISSILAIPLLIWLLPFSFSIPSFIRKISVAILYNGTLWYSISLIFGIVGFFLVSNAKLVGKKYDVAGKILSIIGIVSSIIFFLIASYLSKF